MTASAAQLKQAIEEPESLRSCLKQVEDEIEAISRTVQASKRSCADLAAERKDLVLPARLKKDPAAQDRIRAIDGEIAGHTKDLADDETVLSALGAQSDSLKARIALGEWNLHRKSVMKQLRERIKDDLPGKLAAAAEEVKRLFHECQRRDEETALVVAALDKSLNVEITHIRRMAAMRSELLAAEFYSILPIHLSSTYVSHLRKTDMETQFKAAIDRAIEAVDDLEPAF